MKKISLLGMSALVVLAPSAFASNLENTSETIKEMQKKQLKTVSKDMEAVLDRLESDWSFIEAFLNSPEATLAKYDLTTEERNALTTRSSNELLELGYDSHQVAVVLSGTHHGTGNGMGTGINIKK